MTERCPLCDAPLPFAGRRHIRDCEKILLGLLGEQVTPTVETEGGEPPPDFGWV